MRTSQHTGLAQGMDMRHFVDRARNDELNTITATETRLILEQELGRLCLVLSGVKLDGVGIGSAGISPSCGFEVVLGFGKQPVATPRCGFERYEAKALDDFNGRRDSYQTQIEFWVSVQDKVNA